MPQACFVTLADRGLLAISGTDRVRFLQGLISNDVEKVTAATAVYAAFLTPQGKYLFDFIIMVDGDRLLLDCEAARLGVFAKRLGMYRLRSQVSLAEVGSGWRVHAAFGARTLATLGLDGPPGTMVRCRGGLAMIDPRLSDLGVRLVLPADMDPADLGLAPGSWSEYEMRRIGLGVPDGSRDMTVDKTILLEAGFDELNGIDWHKGCYMGQELTARTKYRGLVKRRLLPVDVDGALPVPGTTITLDGRDVGEIRSGCGKQAMAMIRLNMLSTSGTVLQAGDTRVVPQRPDWAKF